MNTKVIMWSGLFIIALGYTLWEKGQYLLKVLE